jgi:hypothetical protein
MAQRFCGTDDRFTSFRCLRPFLGQERLEILIPVNLPQHARNAMRPKS